MGHANRHNMLSELNGAKKTTQSQNEHIQMKKKNALDAVTVCCTSASDAP